MRLLFSAISITVLWLTSWRCKRESSHIISNRTPQKQKNVSGSDTQKEVTTARPQNTIPTVLAACESTSALTDRMEIEKIALAPEHLRIIYATYGHKKTTIIGFNFPVYSHQRTPLRSIFICAEDGLVIAQRGFSTFSDLREDGTVIPMVIEHLDLSEHKSFHFVLVLDDQRVYRFPSESPWTITSTFANKGVIDASLDPDHQFHSIMIPIRDSIYTTIDTKILRPFSADQIKSFHSYRNVAVTDISGHVLSKLGEEFTDYYQYAIFVTYYLVNNHHYVRTIIRVS